MSSQSGAKMAPKLIELVKPNIVNKYTADFKPMLMEHLAQRHKLLSIPTNVPKNVANVGGERSYVLLGSLAKLESALMKWTMNELVSRFNFTPVVVPNIIHDHIIEKCGFPTHSNRSQVYKIAATNKRSILDDISREATTLPLQPFNDNSNTNGRKQSQSCIAGTSEFALASIHVGDVIPHEDLPKRYCAISRCYRAETSSISSEWGIYRVHYFNKVEMFAFTMPAESAKMHQEFLAIQKDLFSQLNLHFQVLDMPEDDLGLSAKKKYDIEAWMGGRQRYGEISSTSNCEDYQSSRLNIKYSRMMERDNQLEIDSGFLHTVNGTACSSIRTIIALFEQNQTEDHRVELPDVLVPYMDGVKSLPTERDLDSLEELDLYPDPTK